MLQTNTDPIIIFGGTFDPIHNGHLQLANRLYQTFNTPVTFIPTGIPPHKPLPKANAQQRLAMLKLAIANNPNYLIDTREIETNNYCYTYKTLQQIRLSVGNKIPIYFLIGGDSLATLDTWDYWEALFDLTNFVVAWRAGYAINKFNSTKLAMLFNQHKTTNFNDLSIPCGKFYLLDFTPQDISSTAIRTNISQCHDVSSLIPTAVNNYVKQQRLYFT